ncbi:XdhC family protein [Subtercola frigoramans]|uniref:Xanthine dehydrogenase accessory factor n=1 Tax=Subtercola frigoramans TaxID=120298 RepID=A0ABS2L735_9MICO|nr:XdhC/CoxI family protein [Subtercola frigoramans]MBM7472913.1 xanthine dehydrogenase accessory factor [Subtercola frigoramans]
MLELAEALLARVTAGQRVAVATVTRIDGSAPRSLGTAMAVDEAGSVIGSISGGCVEGAVYEACQEVLLTGVPRLEEFGYTDDDAFAVGLACGGHIEVLVQVLDSASPAPLLAELAAAAEGQPAGLAVDVGGGSPGGIQPGGVEPGGVEPGGVEPGGVEPGGVEPRGSVLGAVLAGGVEPSQGGHLSPTTTRRLLAELASRISAGRTGRVTVDCEEGPLDVLFTVRATPPRMIIFGAVDFSSALSAAAALLGYRVTICDARPVFATAARFPAASEVVVEWPSDYLARTEIDARTVVCVLTHDDKFDVPLLEVALRLPIAYVGAMGSRKTHERRLAALRQSLSAAELAALHSPIGLDLGASSPEETAVSILAEVLAAKNGASGRRLAQTEGPIHRSSEADQAIHAAHGI